MCCNVPRAVCHARGARSARAVRLSPCSFASREKLLWSFPQPHRDTYLVSQAKRVRCTLSAPRSSEQRSVARLEGEGASSESRRPKQRSRRDAGQTNEVCDRVSRLFSTSTLSSQARHGGAQLNGRHYTLLGRATREVGKEPLLLTSWSRHPPCPPPASPRPSAAAAQTAVRGRRCPCQCPPTAGREGKRGLSPTEDRGAGEKR